MARSLTIDGRSQRRCTIEALRRRDGAAADLAGEDRGSCDGDGHALVGAVTIGVIRNALNLLNVDVFFQMIAIGLIIVLAVEADVRSPHRPPVYYE